MSLQIANEVPSQFSEDQKYLIDKSQLSQISNADRSRQVATALQDHRRTKLQSREKQVRSQTQQRDRIKKHTMDSHDDSSGGENLKHWKTSHITPSAPHTAQNKFRRRVIRDFLNESNMDSDQERATTA